MPYETIRTDLSENIFTITIDRPDKLNALNTQMIHDLLAAFDEADADDAVRAIVVTGAGRAFCAGADLKGVAEGRGNRVTESGDGPMGPSRMLLSKPVIAAVEGYAVAGGLEVALACDLIVAARGARLGIPEVKRSLVAAGGGLLRLPRVLPRNVAMELALTGENFTAERAHALGMVNVLAEPGGALDAAIALAEKITANGPLAVAATKRIIVESRGWSPDTMFGNQNEILMPVFSSNDAKEGAIAFAEKRPARWTGT